REQHRYSNTGGYFSLGSNRKYLNCLSQHLRSTHKTTIPHLQHKLKMLRQQTCVCLLFFSSFLCYLVSLWIFLTFWETMILKPQVFKHL
uniref:Uncharacterized protein n=1 Tax=Anas platyrhynchos TaxID=8839 RepID=A0A8B9ZBD4_ANAPL